MKKYALNGLILFGALIIGVPAASAGDVHHVPREFATIQSAVDAAQPGDIIQVSRGTFSENVLINTKADLRLYGRNTLLQGSGAGIGILITNSQYIDVQGFIVDGYEAGVVLENTVRSVVHNVETRNNDSATPSLRDGVQLVGSYHNQVTNVYAHHNGHNGITLKQDSLGVGSTNNTLQRNRTNDNGQNPAVAASIGGCGIQLISSGNHDNTIVANEALRNGWGIQVGGGSDGNHVAQNRSHENQRAGVVVLDSGMDNFIGQNNAKRNGLADVAPSGTFDLFDQGVLDNIWRNNQGTFNH